MKIASTLQASHIYLTDRLDNLETMALDINARVAEQLVQKQIMGFSDEFKIDLAGVRAGLRANLKRLRWHDGIKAIQLAIRRSELMIDDALGEQHAEPSEN
jgi:hypothetical protein